MSKPSKRAAIFFWEGYISVAPSLMNALHNLSQAGYCIDVIARKPLDGYPPVSGLPDGVILHQFVAPSELIKSWLTARGFRTFSNVTAPAGKAAPIPGEATTYERLKSTFIGPLLVQTLLLLDFLQFFLLSLVYLWRQSYCIFFGIDVYGLTTATFMSKLKRVPVIYWSLELVFMRDLTIWLERRFKALERAYSHDAQLILIQDQLRAQSLVKENDLDRRSSTSSQMRRWAFRPPNRPISFKPNLIWRHSSG